MKKVLVGIATRQRPKMLAELLESIAGLSRDDGMVFDVLVVENDQALTVTPLVEALDAQIPGRATAVLEPQLGISFARNVPIEHAIEHGYDWLAFVDDDEVVDADWLVNLWRTAEEHELDLIGGPVDQTGPKGVALSKSEQMVLDTYVGNCARRRAALQDQILIDQEVYTNNWLCRVDLLRSSGIRFEAALALSGGEDQKLSRDLRAIGARIGWARDANVTETVPRARLTAGYYFKRKLHHNTVNFQERYPKLTISAVVKTLFHALIRIPLGAICVALGAVFGFGLVLAGMRQLAFGIGRLRAIFRVRGVMYRTVTGH